MAGRENWQRWAVSVCSLIVKSRKGKRQTKLYNTMQIRLLIQSGVHIAMWLGNKRKCSPTNKTTVTVRFTQSRPWLLAGLKQNLKMGPPSTTPPSTLCHPPTLKKYLLCIKQYCNLTLQQKHKANIKILAMKVTNCPTKCHPTIVRTPQMNQNQNSATRAENQMIQFKGKHLVVDINKSFETFRKSFRGPLVAVETLSHCLCCAIWPGPALGSFDGRGKARYFKFGCSITDSTTTQFRLNLKERSDLLT